MLYSWPVLHPVTASLEFARMLVGVELEVEVGKSGELVTVAVAVAIAVPLDEALEEPCFRVPRTAPTTTAMIARSMIVSASQNSRRRRPQTRSLLKKGSLPTPDAFSCWFTPAWSKIPRFRIDTGNRRN